MSADEKGGEYLPPPASFPAAYVKRGREGAAEAGLILGFCAAVALLAAAPYVCR